MAAHSGRGKRRENIRRRFSGHGIDSPESGERFPSPENVPPELGAAFPVAENGFLGGREGLSGRKGLLRFPAEELREFINRWDDCFLLKTITRRSSLAGGCLFLSSGYTMSLFYLACYAYN